MSQVYTANFKPLFAELRSLLRKWHSLNLSLPNIYLYYVASQLRVIPFLSMLSPKTQWAQIEALWLAPIHPSSLFWSCSKRDKHLNPLTTTALTLTIWNSVKSRFKLISIPSVMTPFIGHGAFPPGLCTSWASPWTNQGLSQFHDILEYLIVCCLYALLEKGLNSNPIVLMHINK